MGTASQAEDIAKCGIDSVSLLPSVRPFRKLIRAGRRVRRRSSRCGIDLAMRAGDLDQELL